MKKLFKRLLSYNLMFLIILLIIAKPMNVHAIGGFFTTDSFTFDGSWTDGNDVSHTAYTMQDDNNLPSGYRYYMKVSDGVAICCDAGEVIPNILNYKIGVSMSMQTLANFITSYTQDTSLLGREPTFYDQHPPVLKNGELVGIALNSITGCKMAYATNDDPVTIPSDVTNDVYNYFINVYMVNNPVIDYIVVQTFDGAMPTWGYGNNAQQLTANNLIESSSIICALGYNVANDNNAYYYRGTSYNEYNRVQYDNDILVTEGASTFNSLVNVFQLTAENNYISWNDQYYNSSGYYTWCNVYKKSDFTQRSDIKTEYITSSGEIWEKSGTTNKVLFMGRDGNAIRVPTSSHDTVTIYKNITIPQSITNNTYSPSYYTSSNTTNYSTSNDNSYTSNVQNINNSTSNNQNIYNETKTTTNNNITENDYNYDYSQQITTNTTIINNYYGDNGAPDNGGGDDNGGGGDDDDDDTIWKALLKAIGDFLKKIGELIATVLTGIISILTSVLDAIASITTSFSTITDFLGAVFGFLPSELVAVITLGVTLGILISLIKMFGK